jgi:endonuclease G
MNALSSAFRHSMLKFKPSSHRPPMQRHQEVADRVDLSSPSRVSNSDYLDTKENDANRQAYYGDPQKYANLSPSEMFDELSSLVSGTHKPLDYKPDQYLYPEVDRHPDGELYCIYSGEGPKYLGQASAQGALKKGQYNCEHVVPQSWFEKKSEPRGDLHHLYTSLIECNSLRGNAQYDQRVSDGEAMLACGIASKEDNLFNPHAGHGETARAVLYFMLRYPGKIGDKASEYGPSDLPMLLKWHKENPPTDYERHRNQEIEERQGNRNPLIDFPEWADRIDFARGLGKVAR